MLYTKKVKSSFNHNNKVFFIVVFYFNRYRPNLFTEHRAKIQRMHTEFSSNGLLTIILAQNYRNRIFNNTIFDFSYIYSAQDTHLGVEVDANVVPIRVNVPEVKNSVIVSLKI